MNLQVNKFNLINFLTKKLFPFYKSAEIKKFFEIISKNETDKSKDFAMFVGGCVRNFLKDETIKDIDIATIFPPEIIKEKFKNTKFKIIETGLEHGTLTVVGEDFNYELTTLRKDITTDGRHAEVEFSADWTKDSERRDFTINAIYLNKNGKIFDPQSGLIDLENNIVKFIGDPEKRIQEDYLRIIRFIRFSIFYNHSPEKTTIDALKVNLTGIKNLSRERIFDEFNKILETKNFLNINKSKEIKDLFAVIFPECKYLSRIKYVKEINSEIILNSTLLISLMVLDKSSNYEYFCHKYKSSNNLKEKLSNFQKTYLASRKDNNFFTNDLQKNLYFFGKEAMISAYLINKIDNKKIKDLDISVYKILKTSIPKFPIKGDYLLKQGFKEGPELGEVLKSLENVWIDNNFDISDKDVRNLIKNLKSN
tara:strand:- start:12 stop:1280 length:1269 start_codon:yes stop_codon:yes gene_type:complete